MYKQFFGLSHSPFSIAPDPRYLYMSERHREALAHLLYGVGSGGGFVLLTGEIGAGKTTVCRCFIEQVPSTCKLAYVFNPRLTVEELLQAVCAEFGIEVPPATSTRGYVDLVNRHLLAAHAAGMNSVLVIDEAQNLTADVLEQLRLLTNLETNERKLLQIILIGQPELRTMLARPELEQLAQRVIARYHLGPLTRRETANYIAHRMAVAGHSGAPAFTARVAARVHGLTGGVPRRINLLCDRALLGAYVENDRTVTTGILRRAAREVFAPATPRAARRWALFPAGAACAMVIGAAAAWQLAPVPAVPVTATHATAPAAAAAPSLAPLEKAAHGGFDAALDELARLWGAGTPAAGCDALAANGLRCHHGRGGLRDLIELDRPAILVMRAGEQVQYAVLAGIDADAATLLAGGKRLRVATGELATRMDGRFTTLMRLAAPFRASLRHGEQGADVEWLAQQLGVAASPGPRRFDPALQEALRAFQARHGLEADGLAGPLTLMQMNREAGIDEPRLAAAGNR